ncbi:MAG TPA: orotate phosphoribosyltransferase [Sphingomonadales bacterium]|nr:orotate phosphoribosyltransferase [Sphingomonadales bacterium]
MTREEVLREFRDAGALLEGHFLLSSGLHSPQYLQCALVLQDARRAVRLAQALAAKVREKFPLGFDLVVSPAMGGVVVGYEMGRQLGVPAIFTERVEGVFTLRRGFSISKGAKVLMVEDVVTTGLSSRECIAAAKAAGGEVIGAAALVDRSGGRARLGVPFVALITLDVPAYKAGEVPPELAKIPAVKPGSRGLKA